MTMGYRSAVPYQYQIYRALINEEEMHTGRPSQKPQEVTLVEAAYDLETRPHLARRTSCYPGIEEQ